jgi:hypothetical protein
MPPHVFAQKPKYCLALKPAIIWVRCAKCGAPHEEYLGPRNFDARAAQISFLLQEYLRTVASLKGRRQATLRRGRSRSKSQR